MNWFFHGLLPQTKTKCMRKLSPTRKVHFPDEVSGSGFGILRSRSISDILSHKHMLQQLQVPASSGMPLSLSLVVREPSWKMEVYPTRRAP